MDFPGEKLAVKLVDVFEKLVGSACRPWQIRREGRANADAKRELLLTLAQAERDAEAIRKGERHYSDGELTALTTIQKKSGILQLMGAANSEAEYLNLRRAINLRRIELIAHEEAANTPNDEVSDKPIDPDWFARWRDAAQDVSSDEMQQLWAKLLTGEVKSPGKFNLQTVALLRILSRQQAEWIAALGAFNINGWMYRDCDEVLQKKGITIDVLYELEGLNVIGAVDHIGGLVHTVKLDPITETESAAFVGSMELGLLIKHKQPAPVLEIPMYKILRAGQELISLGKFNLEKEYLRSIAHFAMKQGYSVNFATCNFADNRHVKITSQEPIPAPS